MVDLLEPLPLVTADLPGIGGSLKQQPSDFEVEEIPAYEPAGDGEHLYLWIEKEGVSADALIRHLGRTLGIPCSEIGCAGLKDAAARTRQYVSVPASCAARSAQIESAQIRVLHSKLHRNKLKTGHLRGNRFRILVRDPRREAAAHGHAIVERLLEHGVPNYYGAQRFGHDGETLRIGLALLRGERSPELGRVPPGRRGFLRRLALSSVQSALFNRCLKKRLEEGLLHTVILGEVMQVCASGGPFLVDDVEREQRRFAAHEVVPAGPIFGPKMRAARGVAAAREAAVLEEAGLAERQFAEQGKLMLGTRRAYLVFPGELSLAERSEGLELSFTLPRGSYATVLLQEVMKHGVSVAGDEEED